MPPFLFKQNHRDDELSLQNSIDSNRRDNRQQVETTTAPKHFSLFHISKHITMKDLFNATSEDSSSGVDDIIDDDASTGTTSRSHVTGQASSSGGQDEYTEMQKFQANETRRVILARRVVVASILIAGGFMSALVYMILRDQIENDVNDQFELFANTIEDSFKFQITSIFDANRALSRGITSSAFALGATLEFPHFAVPAFESLAYEARLQGGFEVIMYAPVANQLSAWLDFTQETRQWLDESKEMYDNLEPGEDRSAEPPVGPLPDMVFDYDENGQLVPRTRDGFFTPILHVSPPPVPEMEIYQNINLFSKQEYRDVGDATVMLRGKTAQWIKVSVCIARELVNRVAFPFLFVSDSVFSKFETEFSDFVDSVIGVERHELLHKQIDRQKDVSDYRIRPHSAAAQRKEKN